jgi:DNA-binding winged helix-turn-helix (wHTH) protein/TolB-like protein/Flp pilus assembly protein TadD
LFYEFGEFRLDTEKHRLLRDGEIVAVTPKAVETLTLLVQQRGRLVERDDLMNLVWPGVSVEPGNLDVTISKLRKALGEDGNGRKFIETVPRLGYKFVADVREVAEEIPALIVEKQTSGRIVIEEQVGLTRLPVGAALARLLSAKRRSLTVAGAAAAIVLVFGAFIISWNRKPSVPAARIQSVAIMPLKSLNQNVADDALSLGMADALMTSLGRISGVRVLSAGAVSRRADVREEPVEIGRQLNVDSVLDGTLQRANGKLRVTLRLIRTSDGLQLWSQSFDELDTDVFKLQDAMAARTAESLKWNFSGDEQFSKRYTQNREAYEAYLRGRYFFDKRDPQNYQKAIAEFERAIALDPNYALAYSGLADAYGVTVNLNEPLHTINQKARLNAQKALELDETLAEAHTSVACLKRAQDWDWEGSEKHFKRAIELDPNYVNARQWYALLLITLGRVDEAITQIEKARELEPLSKVVLLNAYQVYVSRKDPNVLWDIVQRILALEDSEANRLRLLTQFYERIGNYHKAIQAGEELTNKLKVNSTGAITSLAIAYMRTGQEEKAREMFAYLEGRPKNDTGALYHLAMIHSMLGYKEKAIELMHRSFENHDARMLWIKIEPRLDPLRDDQRFQQIIRRMHLPA